MPSCAICSIEAPSDKHLRLHIQAKHDDRVLTCEKCEVTCKGGMKLRTHMDSHRKITCKHCEKEIPYNSRSSHMTKCVGDKKAIKCENCPAVFNTAGSLKACKRLKSHWSHWYGFSPVCVLCVLSKHQNHYMHHCKRCMWILIWILKLSLKKIDIYIGGNFYASSSGDSSTCLRQWKHLYIFHTSGNSCESSSFLQRHIHSCIGHICKKNYPQCQWSQVILAYGFIR